MTVIRRIAMSLSMWSLASCLLGGATAEAACPARHLPAASFHRRTNETAQHFPERVRALEDFMFTLREPEAERAGIRTDGLLVLHQGAVFYERYARGYDRETPHLAWSITKTITQLLLGIGIERGEVALDDSVCASFPNAPSDHCGLTLRHLVEHASGLDWNEDYEDGSRQASSVIAMLYGEGKDDMASFVLRQPFSDLPGTAFRYSTGDSTLLAAVLDRKLAPRFGADYPWTLLFDRIGVTQMTLEVDGAGHHVGGAYSFATLEDWARLGMLMLDDGCWDGDRIMPQGWLEAATLPSMAFVEKRHDALPTEEYGRGLWLNRTVPGVRELRPFPSVPEDAFLAIGHWGQFIIVVPSRDVVIVRAGDERDEHALDIDRFVKLALALVGDAS